MASLFQLTPLPGVPATPVLILGMDVQLIQLQVAAVKGKIAVIIRGNCPFVDKITIAQDNGAIGVIIINNVPAGGPVNGGGVLTKRLKSYNRFVKDGENC
jgi:hypothetical protein